MATERSLATLLRSLQVASEPQDAYSLLPTSTSFLSMLTNPLNLTLLSTQLLTSPTIWNHQVDLQTCRRILGVFHTAATTVLQANEPDAKRRGLQREAWVKAVVKGADEKSPRWRHMLLLAGILLGFEGQNRQGLSPYIRGELESALVKATRLALGEKELLDEIVAHCTTMVLNYTFELLSDWEKSQLDYDCLLPLIVQTTFFSDEGLECAYFLGAIDREVAEVPGKKLRWSSQSSTYNHVKMITSKPLISSLGPLSRLIAYALEKVRDPGLISDTLNSVSDFVRTLMIQWRQNKLSEVDPSEEAGFLDAESLQMTLPDLWRLLRSCMFSTTIILRAVLGRVLVDPILAADDSAPFLSIQTLHIIRNLYFITSRIGRNASSQYVFVNLTAIDILARYPGLVENFLRTIKPNELGQIPDHPLERCLDLFFLNTIEHFTLVLSPEVNNELAISAALPYIAAGGDNKLLAIFEAAHSVVLAVFAAPKNADITANHLPFYVDNLFMVFPESLSPRQFRLAIKSITQIATPPSPLAQRDPLLASAVLELVHDHALRASSAALPPSPPSPGPVSPTDDRPLSEQAVLCQALIDSFCFLRVGDLEEWLPLTAKLINGIQDADMREACMERFWDAISGGEMDVERAHFCLTWWSTRGGRELVLFGAEVEAHPKTIANEASISDSIRTFTPESKS